MGAEGQVKLDGLAIAGEEAHGARIDLLVGRPAGGAGLAPDRHLRVALGAGARRIRDRRLLQAAPVAEPLAEAELFATLGGHADANVGKLGLPEVQPQAQRRGGRVDHDVKVQAVGGPDLGEQAIPNVLLQLPQVRP